MSLTFNALLREVGIDPGNVRLLRHETKRHGRTPYSLWCDDRDGFADYQRVQKQSRRGYFASPFWAAFVVEPSGKTLFAGLWAVQSTSQVPDGWIDPISGRDAASLAAYELYETARQDTLSEYVGRLFVGWGSATRTWAQRADARDKPIVELRETFVEPAFPGYVRFISQLSELDALPSGWRQALRAVGGVYLLTCPKTREQYVGSASGADGFLGRWGSYVENGHGGNVILRSRHREDYYVSILQVAGSADDRNAILAMESIWMAKLQSRAIGLNS